MLGPNSLLAVAVNPSQMYWMHGEKEKVEISYPSFSNRDPFQTVVKFDLFSHGAFRGAQNDEPIIRVIRLDEEQALIHEETVSTFILLFSSILGRIYGMKMIDCRLERHFISIRRAGVSLV